MAIYYESELYHHGVKGMRWGHRKARPAAPKKELAEVEGKAPKKKGLSDKHKKVVKVGAAVAGTALAVYGGYKLNKYVRDTNYEYHREKGEQLARNYLDSLNVHKTNIKLRSDYDTAAKRFEGAVRLNQKSIGTRQKEMTRAAQRMDKFNDGIARVAANKQINEVRKADTDNFVTAAKNAYQYSKRKRR